MKLSTTTAIYRDRPEGIARVSILDSIKKLSQIGFEDVDLNFCLMSKRKLELSRADWKEWIKEAKVLLEDIPISVGQAHAPFYNVLDGTYENREHTEEMIRRSIIAAGELGAKVIVIHAGTYFSSNDYKKMLLDNIEYLKPHIELCAKYNISLAVENLFDKMDNELGYRRPRFSSRVEDLLELIDRLSNDYRNVGICWDFGHANEMGWDQCQALDMIGERLIAVHVQDNYGIKDDHLLPYHGTIEWEPIMKALRRINYEGVFCYETHKAAMRIPEPIIDDFLRYALKLGNYLISLYEEGEKDEKI